MVLFCFTVPRLVPVSEEVTSQTPSPRDPAPSPTPTLFMAVVSGAVIVLLLLLLFGVAWKQGKMALEREIYI